MPQNLYPPARPQTVGEVLKTGTKIFRLSLNSVLPYSVIVAVCTELANLRNLSVDLPVPNPLQNNPTIDPVWWVWYVVGSILSLLFGSALLLRQKALAAGERTSVTAELRQAGVLLSRLIVCMALSTFAVVVGLVPVAAALPMTGLNPAMTNLSIEAMRASFRLLRGNWWRTSVLTAALAGVLILMTLVVGAAAALVVMGTGTMDLKVINTLAIPLGILCGAIILPWCGAQVLAMMGDLTVRQADASIPGPAA
jgi:hypothetical protein